MSRYQRLIYAEVTDLPEDLQTLEDAQERIEAASDIITWLIRNARYEVDEAGKPTDTDLLGLLKDATITQAIFADDKYGGADVPEDMAPAQLGSLRFGAPDSDRNPNWGTRIWQNVSPAAWYMLHNAGLIVGQVRTL